MVKIIYVDKNGILSVKSSRNTDVNELYKKCNLKNTKDFDLRHTWNVNIDKSKLLTRIGTIRVFV